MLVPVSLCAIAVSAFTYGMVKRSDGNRDVSKANEISSEAKERHENAIREQKKDKEDTDKSVEKYGILRLFVRQRTFNRFVNFLKSIDQQAFCETNKEFLCGLEVPLTEQIQEYESVIMTAKETVKNFVSSTSAGLAASVGTIGYAQAVGTVTVPHFFGLWTTKIAVAELGLSGAIAWLGDGSPLIGTAILSCIMIGPTLTIEGFRSASRGAKALTQAQNYSTAVSLEITKIEVERDFLRQVKRRIEELDKLLEDINERFVLKLRELESTSFELDRDGIKFQQLFLLIKALEELVEIPILSSVDNSINPNTETIQIKYSELWES